MKFKNLYVAFVLCLIITRSYSQKETVLNLDTTPTRVQTSLNPGLKKIGTLLPRSVDQINTSMWSLGCETLDRNLADWNAYKYYLVPLGIRHVRLQGGWGRTEKEKGVYNFAWLDSLVDNALSLGLQVCLETSYGNRLYEEKAALGPGGKLPSGEETLTAWDAWVKKMVKRYSKRGVHDWMMYNEPNLNKENKIEEIAEFNIRTAEIIKRVDKNARIGGLVVSDANPQIIENYLKLLKDEGKEILFYWLVYHAYGANPDEVYSSVEQIQMLIAQYAPHLKLWQGEAGCASEEVQYALKGVDWTELSHAKWNARRMIGDIGHGVKSAVFTISDLSYHRNFISRYGLLKTNPDNSIIKVKTAYYVVQNVVSVLNDEVTLVSEPDLNISSEKEISCYLFKDKSTDLPLIAFWDGTSVPSNDCDLQRVSFTLEDASFKKPVWVDLMTGNIYEIPTSQVSSNNGKWYFEDIPYYDGPCLIADKSILNYSPVRKK